MEEPGKEVGSVQRKHAPARSAVRSSSPPPVGSSVQFVSCGELPARNRQRPRNRVQYLSQPIALGRRKVQRRLDGLSITK